MGKSATHANAQLDETIANSSTHASTYISLHTGDPGTTGANEASDAGASNYARVQVNQDGATGPYWNAASSSEMTNNGIVAFPEGGDGQTITHFGVWVGGTVGAGTFLRGGALGSSFGYSSSTTPQFANGAISLTEA